MTGISSSMFCLEFSNFLSKTEGGKDAVRASLLPGCVRDTLTRPG